MSEGQVSLENDANTSNFRFGASELHKISSNSLHPGKVRQAARKFSPDTDLRVCDDARLVAKFIQRQQHPDRDMNRDKIGIPRQQTKKPAIF